MMDGDYQKKLREIDVRNYGPKNTRKNKRKSKKLYQRCNGYFMNLCNDFNNDYINNNFDFKKIEGKYNQLSHKWKSFARNIIKKNIDEFNTKAKRDRFIKRFQEFIDNLLEKTNGESG